MPSRSRTTGSRTIISVYRAKEITQLDEKRVAGAGEIRSRRVELIEGAAVSDKHHGPRRRPIREEPIRTQRIGMRRVWRAEGAVAEARHERSAGSGIGDR